MPAAAGSFLSAAAPGVDTVAGLAWTPKALVLSLVANSSFSDTVAAAQHDHSLTVTDGTTTRCISNREQDAAGISVTARGWSNTVRLVDVAGAVTVEGTVALTSDGFTITWATIPSSMTVSYWLIGGSNISAKVLLFNRSATGTASVTGAGFQPKALIGLGTATADANSTTAADSLAEIGIVDDDADNFGTGYTTRDNITTMDSATRHAASFLTRVTSGNSTDTTITATSLDADGFSYNASVHPGSARYYAVLCLGGSDLYAAEAVTLTADTTTGAHTQTFGGLPFEPNAGLLIGNSNTGYANTVSTRMAVGAFDDDLEQWGMVIGSEDGIPTAIAKQGHTDASSFLAYIATTSVDLTMDAVGAVSAKTASSIDVAWGANKTAVQYIWSALLLELNMTPPGPPEPPATNPVMVMVT